MYRARDGKLDREVAIKVLPASVATDPDALTRFEREARAVAALSLVFLPPERTGWLRKPPF